MKAVIFVPSTSLIRGSKWLAPKAGLFCFPATGILISISSGLPLPSAKKRTARESGLVDSGIWWAAFLSACNVNKSHNAHRNSISRRPAAHQIPHYHSGPIAQAGGRNGKATTPAARRVYSTKAGNKAPGVSSISLSFSVL